METNTLLLKLLVMAAITSFVLGSYYQHNEILRNIKTIVRNDPYAFHIRRKLYSVLDIFQVDDADINKTAPATRLEEIMKYGFPGMDDIRLYEDFVLSYDRRNRVAHWVYEHLRPSSLSNATGVQRKFAHYQADMSVPSNFRADLTDYHRSGFDRGHLAAAGNHKTQQSHCNETFFLTNIAPQVGKGFNRDAWNKLEIYVRELAERYGSIYVCTGPLYRPKSHRNGSLYVDYEVIGAKTVAVPTHFFKVIIVDSKLALGKPYMEAYLMPNAFIDDDVDIRSFLCDIAEIERVAGLQFFNGLRRSFFFDTNYATVPELYSNFN